MSTEIYIAYLLTVLALMSTPGPSHILMLSNASANGSKRAMATAAGDLTANFLQMLAAGLGMSALITNAPHAFNIIKIVGVAYLVWLGVKMFHKSFKDQTLVHSANSTSLKTLWLQGFITSATNPKAVIFFAALFPQFLNPSAAFWPQFAVLSLSFLVIDGSFLTGYGIAADKIRHLMQRHGTKWIDRLGGTGVLIAALLLGLKTLPRPA
jgi:threonine/homoserine/homoserine lactone efflux protein